MQKERGTLLDMMLKGHLDAEMYKRKDQELGSLVTHLKVRLEGRERGQAEIGDIALKLLEHSQTLKINGLWRI